LDPANGRGLLERGVRRVGELGLRPTGFRPPGGELTRASVRLLQELGFGYCSPAGEAVDSRNGIVVLPFRWPLIDAFHYLPHFGDLRQRFLGSGAALPPARLRDAVAGALDEAVRDGTFVALLFHPFLAEPDERFDVIRGALARVRALVDDGAARCAPCRD